MIQHLRDLTMQLENPPRSPANNLPLFLLAARRLPLISSVRKLITRAMRRPVSASAEELEWYRTGRFEELGPATQCVNDACRQVHQTLFAIRKNKCPQLQRPTPSPR